MANSECSEIRIFTPPRAHTRTREGWNLARGRSTDTAGPFATWVRCRSCTAWVVRGLDAQWSALSVDADPVPLTTQGEAWVWLEGGRTVALFPVTDRAVLRARSRFEMRSHPAGADWDGAVLPVHLCGRPAPRGSRYRAPGRLRLRPTPAAVDATETVPF